ncbi:MAG: TIGR01777 family oxidoreductase [Ignavibacteria bacterium]|nr:TIGR01777 family oxidoreductase [Ignavibacteria bacterium]
MPEIITIFGGTGFLGGKLAAALCDKYIINIAARNVSGGIIGFDNENIRLFKIDDTIESYKNAISGSIAVVNFSGASIAGKRWSKEYKQTIYDSRILTTRKIVEALSLCEIKPSVLVNTSASGYYGNRFDEKLTEESGPGKDFLAKLCVDWEKEALAAKSLNVRTVCVRIGFVLDKYQGGLKELLTPFKYFAGSILGNGRQYMPWIHIEDVIGIYLHSLFNSSVSGAINAVSPNPVTNREFSKTLAGVMKRPCLFRVPGFALKIMVGEFSEFLLSGQKIFPLKADTSGYKFRYILIKEALTEILK